MVVQHNLRAMNSNRMLGLTANVQSKSAEKLSSGYKINRAADDAAGLSISEKMRKQIRGLSQASLNAADGISAVQTAEGALNEVQDMLQRMNELAVKAANGTMSENDRSYIQNEIDQLVTEIDRVSETTKFNETYLLKGGSEAPTTNVYNYAEAADPQLVWGTGMQTESGKFSVEYLNDASVNLSFKGDDKVISVDVAYNSNTITGGKEIEWLNPATNSVTEATFVGVVSTSDAGPGTGYVLSAYNGGAAYWDKDGQQINGTNYSNYVNVNSTNGDVTLKAGVQIYSEAVAVPSKLYATDTQGNTTEVTSNNYSQFVEVNAAGTSAVVKDGYTLFNIDSVATKEGNQVTAAIVSKQETLDKFFGVKASILYEAGGASVAESTLSAYVDTDGNYKQGADALYTKNAAGDLTEIGKDYLKNYVTIETNDALWATKGGQTEKVTADNMSEYFEIDSDNKYAIKDGVQIFNSSDNQTAELLESASAVSDRIGTTTTGFYDNAGAAVAESKLSSYFDSTTGEYKGAKDGAQATDKLYFDAAQNNPLGAEAVDEYLNVVPAGAQDINIYAVDNSGKATKVNEGNMDQFFNVDDKGAVSVKEGFQLYTSPTDTTTANKLAESNLSNYVTGSITDVTDKNGNKVAEEELKNYFNEDGSYKGGLYKNGKDEINAAEVTTFVSASKEEGVPDALTLKLHVGADGTSNNQISVDIESMSSKGLGVNGIKIDGADDANATAAIDVIAAAIQKVSEQRSALGAVQNRLEHTIANLDNVVENTTAAESQIRDTDMATEMVKFSNNNILAQAGQAMLAQANQANQGVLSILG